MKALYDLRRTDGRYVPVTRCIGGGPGIAADGEVFKNWDARLAGRGLLKLIALRSAG